MSAQSKEYADIMGRSTSFGTFLFKPQWFTKCSLGSIGYFDKTGDWNQVTNLLEKGRAEKDGYKPFPSESDPLELELSEVTESRWETGSAEKETGRSSRLRTEASGAMAAAPVEASVQVKTKNTSTGSAALVTPSVVRNHKFQGPFKDQIMDWIEDNAPKLHSRRQVRERGLWAIMSAWVTDECAVKMTSGKTRDIDLSFDLGATGIGKAGSGIGVFDKLKREDWQVYSPDERSGGYVVSFAGVEYTPRSFSFITNKIRSAPLKVHIETISLPTPKPPSALAEEDPTSETETTDHELPLESEDGEGEENFDGQGETGYDLVGLTEYDLKAGEEYRRRKAELQDASS